jgi:hypothetical protein
MNCKKDKEWKLLAKIAVKPFIKIDIKTVIDKALKHPILGKKEL